MITVMRCSGHLAIATFRAVGMGYRDQRTIPERRVSLYASNFPRSGWEKRANWNGVNANRFHCALP